MKTFDGNPELLKRSIREWLLEDIGTGDVTTGSTVPEGHESRAVIHMKESGVIAGLPVAEAVFREIDPAIRFESKRRDGDRVDQGDIVAEAFGTTSGILAGERLALNLLQRLSGIATLTRAFVDQVAGLPKPAAIVDTRKTTPGMRALEKYAVRMGGGRNHRFGLYDAVMIKDNHIKAAGGLKQAVERARENVPHTMKIEVETERLEQVAEALDAGADIIMLDNMATDTMAEAVRLIRSRAPHVVVEASGNVSLETVRAIALAGVDVISSGKLTHSAKALDISLDLYGKKGAGL